MKRILIYTSALALLAGTLSPAYAGDHGSRRGHNRTVIIQGQQQSVAPIGLAAILGLTLLAQARPAPLVFPDDPLPDEPKKKFRRAPVEPKLRNPIPPN